MKQIKTVITLLLISTFILSINIKSALSKNNELEDIENAIIINGIDSESEDSLNENDFDNLDGVIIYNNSFNNVSQESKNSSKESDLKENIVDNLKKKDSKWHFTSHKIKSGENLWSIAQKYETDYKLILKANKINNPDFVKPGRLILIPNRKGIDYKVLRGDTVIGLSNKYRVKKDLIITQNNIRKNIIKTGEILFIPDAVACANQIAFNSGVKKNFDKNYTKNNLPNPESGKAERCELVNNKKASDVQRQVFSWPLQGEITSAFGRRIDPINKKTKFHCGIDIRAGIGTPVKAAADGEAIFSGWKKGYGRVVILKHTDGYITVYAHNKDNIVSVGAKVKCGELIALSGMSGAVTGPHLHFEIRKYVTPLNPHRFLK